MARSCCSGTSTATGTGTERGGRGANTRRHAVSRRQRMVTNAPADSPAGASLAVRLDADYVPSLHVARYFTCSEVSESIEVPMLFNFRRATSLSIASGTT